MIILDTNVISAVMRREPDATVVAWLDAQPRTSFWTTTVTVFEIEFGVARLPAGKRRERLAATFASMLTDVLDERVLPFDVPAAREAGRLCAEHQARGRSIEVRDVQIAGIAAARRATVATGNTRHFDALCEVVDPWGR